jgi:hypothetical protein
MNRLKVVSVLVALGSIAIVTVLTSPATQATSLPASSVQQVDRYSRPLAPASDIICSVGITTTSSVPNNYTAQTAVIAASYTGLALVPSPTYPVSPTQPTQVAAVDNWFVLGNATPYFQYTFEAVPDLGGNYNIGMEIYSGSSGALSLIYSNVDTGDGNGAKITAAFPGLGPYYIRIFQISSYCSGGTYRLIFSYITPTPTPISPSFGYGMVMAGPDNLWPQWIGFNYQLVFTSPVFSGGTELMRLTVDASDLDDLPALRDRMSQITAANSSIESFQIGNDPNLSSEWNAPPDAASYSQVLCATYQSIKQARPWAVVVSGGLATTGRVAGTWNGHLGHDGLQQDEREFLKEFIDAGGGACLDALGYNTLGFGANYDVAPDMNGGTPETNCANGLCFRSVEKAYAILQSRGLTKPVWITEVGWLIAPPSACLSDPRWQGRTDQIVTPARQSDNLVGALRYARFQWPWLKAMFVFNLDFNMAPWYDECEPMRYYSVAGQPAFLALGTMSKEVYRVYLPMISK